MSWTVVFDSAFDAEFADLQEDVQDELLARTHDGLSPEAIRDGRVRNGGRRSPKGPPKTKGGLAPTHELIPNSAF